MSKILVIEDDSATRLFLKRDLQISGYEVTVAKDGAEGLRQALNLLPAVIVCDWVMPLMDGLDLCKCIKATPDLADTFFILLSSRDTEADRQEALEAGADDLLSKPVNPDQLIARVQAGFEAYQTRQSLNEARHPLS